MSNFSYTGADNLDAMALAVNYNSYLVEQIIRQAGDAETIIDFGAGCGTFSLALRDRGFNISCVEPDESLREKLARQGFRCYADVSEVSPNSADFIFSLNVLEHIEDDAAIARALFSRLRPGGRLFVYVPAFAVLFTNMDQKVGHYRRYCKTSLRKILIDAGFDISSLRYADSLGFFATLLFKLIGNKDGAINERSLIIYDRFAFPLSRALDVVCGSLFGKNVKASATRPR